MTASGGYGGCLEKYLLLNFGRLKTSTTNLWKLNFDMTKFQLNVKTHSETGIVFMGGVWIVFFRSNHLGEMASVAASGYDM